MRSVTSWLRQGAACPTCIGTITLATGANFNPFSPFYMDGAQWQIGSNVTWSPVKNLDIGVEVIYVRNDDDHRHFDPNRGYPFLAKRRRPMAQPLEDLPRFLIFSPILRKAPASCRGCSGQFPLLPAHSLRGESRARPNSICPFPLNPAHRPKQRRSHGKQTRARALPARQSPTVHLSPERDFNRASSDSLAISAAGPWLGSQRIFIHNGDEIWSFTALPTLITSLEIVADPQRSRVCACSESKLPAGGAKYCRGYCESILRIICLALVYMAYTSEEIQAPARLFSRTKRQSWCHRYCTQDGVQRSRNVVVRRCGGRRPWFKNEGLGYQVVTLGGLFGVQLEPFYIFTGSDANKPLPFAEQIERSSHWNGRDVKIGARHLAFWERLPDIGHASRGPQSRARQKSRPRTIISTAPADRALN